MPDLLAEIERATNGEGPIARDAVIQWIADASDLRALAKLYRLTDKDYYRITPELGKDVSCSLILEYLLGCISEGVENDEEIKSRFDACTSLQNWFRHMLTMEDTHAVLEKAAKSAADFF